MHDHEAVLLLVLRAMSQMVKRTAIFDSQVLALKSSSSITTFILLL